MEFDASKDVFRNYMLMNWLDTHFFFHPNICLIFIPVAANWIISLDKFNAKMNHPWMVGKCVKVLSFWTPSVLNKVYGNHHFLSVNLFVTLSVSLCLYISETAHHFGPPFPTVRVL